MEIVVTMTAEEYQDMKSELEQVKRDLTHAEEHNKVIRSVVSLCNRLVNHRLYLEYDYAPVVDSMRGDGKIEAIKRIRNRLGCELFEAKLLVELAQQLELADETGKWVK